MQHGACDRLEFFSLTDQPGSGRRESGSATARAPVHRGVCTVTHHWSVVRSSEVSSSLSGSLASMPMRRTIKIAAAAAVAGSALAAGSLHHPPAAHLSDGELGHLEIMTFYDFNATAQHGWAVGTFDPYQLAEWRTAWAKWKMHGMWNLEYLTFGGAQFWDRSCEPSKNWSCGLRPGWEAALDAALKTLQPDLASGALTGVFLGDEPMLAGISAANITAAADFIRARVGPKAKLYWNDGCRPFYDGHTEPCVRSPHNPLSCWTNDSKVPASVDWVSCDSYQDPTVATSAWPWDASDAIPEADAQRHLLRSLSASLPRHSSSTAVRQRDLRCVCNHSVKKFWTHLEI